MTTAASRSYTDFFLGALSPSGFTGWFAQAAAEPGVRAYLIKGGPGCGKSTLLRRLAAAGAEAHVGCIQRIHCSSDPKSLDGVYLPGAHAFAADATAPHVLDCKYPGAAERVISLYDTLNSAALLAHRCEILSLGGRNTALLEQASAYFALACGLLRQRRLLAAARLDTAKLDAFTARLARRTMPPRREVAPGARRHRLLSAPTPEGLFVFYDTIPALCDTVYAIHDDDGAVSARMLGLLAEHARQNGYEAILCHCPTDQAEKTDHLFLPELRLGFVTANRWHPMRFAGQKNLHANRFLRREATAPRPDTGDKRLAAELIGKACAAQKRALALHDALERYYIAAADFSAVDRIGAALCAELLPGC